MTDLVKSLKIGNNSYSIKDEKAVPSITKNEEAVLSFTGTYQGTPVTGTNTYLTKDGVVVEKGANPAWTNIPVEYRMYRSIVTNADICVMTINGSDVFMYSTDKGKTWTDIQVPMSGSYDAICYGNGKFVALPYSTASAYALYSTDGINWTQVSTPVARNWSSVCYGGGKYVAVSKTSSDFLYSTNGISWTRSTLPSGMTKGNCIVYGGGKFVVIGELLDKAAYSTNGINWTVTDLPSNAYWRSLAFYNGKFVAAVYNQNAPNAVLAQSDDGITWTSLQLDLKGGCSVASSPVGFVFVDSSKTLFSSDLVSFTEVDGQAAVEAMPKFASYSDTLFLQYGNYSSDISVLPVEVASMSSTTPSWTQSISYGNGMFVATPISSDKGVYSTDGLVWNEMTMPSSDRWALCSYGNGTFVSVANTTSDAAAYSTDGITWQATTLPVTSYWSQLMFADNKFVAATYSTTDVAYSTDGITWQASTHPSIGAINDTACGNGKFVLLSSTSVAYSSDAVTWQSTTLPSGHQWYRVAYGNGKFVVIDYNSSAGSTAALYSTNGSTWQSATLPVAAAWNKPVYGNGVFVITGRTLSSPAVQICAYSTDGITWGLAQLPVTTTVEKVAFGNGFFVVLANNSSMGAYSKDGASWVPFEIPSHTGYTAIVYGSDKFVAAARDRGSGVNWTYYLSAFKIGVLPYSKDLSYTAAEVDTALAGKIGKDSIGNGLSFEEGSLSIVQASNPVWEQPQVNEPGTMGVSDIAVTESGYYTYTGYDLRAYQCFNDGAVLGKDHWQKNVVSTSTYEWVSWYTKTPVNIKSIVVRNNEGAFAPSNYILEGSNDNSSWTTLTSGTNTNVTNFADWTISSQNNNAYYNYYRLKVLPRTSEAVMIGKLFITGYEYTGTGTVAKATNTLYGLVKPDGTSITVDDGVISSSGLVNTATGNNSLTILGTPTTKGESVNIGTNSNLNSGGNRNVAIGYSSIVQTGADYATAMGWYTWVQHSGSIALGAGCRTEKINSFYVAVGGFNSHSYMMMDSSGHIPVERYYPMTGANGTNAGTLGAVPAPAATDNNKFLRGDGTWAEAGSSLTAGSNITIDNGIISSKDTTYMAGTGIELKTSKAYTVVGSPTIVDGVASNFSSSNYLTRSLPWDHTKAWELVVPFMDKDLAVDSTSGVLHFTKSTDSSNYGFRLQTSISSLGARAYFRVYDNTNTMIGQAILDGELQSNVQYYIKITYSPTEGYSLSVSTNETDWTTIGTIASTTPMNSGANKLWMGVRSDQSYPLTNGAIDLKKMYLKAEGSPIWTPAGTVINSTGLVNNSESIQDALSVGPTAEAANTGALAVGHASYSSGEAATAIGVNSQAYADFSVAIGTGALSDAVGAIQLGAGENTTSDSLQFGIYPLFDGSGNLYKERIKNIIEPVQSLPATPVEGKIYLILGA